MRLPFAKEGEQARKVPHVPYRAGRGWPHCGGELRRHGQVAKVVPYSATDEIVALECCPGRRAQQRRMGLSDVAKVGPAGEEEQR